ncbi:HAMP domain-containing histidine kinase [Photobacterium sp. SDRW27]|uniref:sensor histidine kinase n=1 Tax=Photobacterium obscurum TaxID=2829490 RepID=UPI00224334D4|nr:HAMP domain-containing sensor histidine kinase [Photobacterium obscurum]MCW8329926.1 HAMP domain-containing histidine kinase [Photobacterium obscurum]
MSKKTNVKSAKQLTFTYFSIVAFAIIAIHFSLLDATLEDFEQLNANNRLNHAKEVAKEVFDENDVLNVAIPPFSHAYIGKEQLPSRLDLPDSLPSDKATELKRVEGDDTEYFIMKTEMAIKNTPKIVYFLYFDDIYESSEEQIFLNQAKQLTISFVLILISLIVVLRISDRLTNPLSHLADELENRSPNDLSPISRPKGIVSKELLQLVHSFNKYSSRIHQLIERERSFNRYASHELRSPLMVMKGSISLLGQSNEPEFVEKQRQRLLHASNEMNDLVTTLLSLTREENTANLTSRTLTTEEMNTIMSEHAHLLRGKPVEWNVHLTEETMVKVPETVLKILLGNLIKNAYACTEEGYVTLDVSPQSIKVIDSGIGLGAKPRGVEGYGLGLLIANDICRKYGWKLTHYNNESGGCTAEITLAQEEIPSD